MGVKAAKKNRNWHFDMGCWCSKHGLICCATAQSTTLTLKIFIHVFERKKELPITVSLPKCLKQLRFGLPPCTVKEPTIWAASWCFPGCTLTGKLNGSRLETWTQVLHCDCRWHREHFSHNTRCLPRHALMLSCFSWGFKSYSQFKGKKFKENFPVKYHLSM